MKKNFWDIIFKVFILTSVFFVIINYFWYLLNADSEKGKIKNNIDKFKSSDVEEIWTTWVAIWINIWTRYKEMKETPIQAYKDVVDIWYVLGNQNIAKDKIITTNMIILNEYFNILKTDIRSLLSSADDREFILNSFISQLEYRYKNSTQNIKTLLTQKSDLVKAYNDSNDKIESLKIKISSDFWNLNNKDTIENIDLYLKSKQENTNVKTYIVFIDKFLYSYWVLNEYNKKVLDTLINNKELIIKNSQVVIPDTGTDLLKELKLIYSEEEWKKQ